MKRKALSIILFFAMLFALMPNVAQTADAAPNRGSCSIAVNEKATSYEMNKGGQLTVDLSSVFTSSQGHTLSFSVTEMDAELKGVFSSGKLTLSPLVTGSFQAKVRAVCTEDSGVTATASLQILVKEPENAGNPAQYGYDETPADSVSMYVTVSSDGIPLMGNDTDNTVLAHQKIRVPYFDLSLYGMEDYYRYHTENGSGQYVDEEVVERPTAMHLFIYITERFYMGLPESECCHGTSGILEYEEHPSVTNLYGETAYTDSHKAYTLTGGATSTYMSELWGHDENLMYYRNHYFPLMSAGWGATADYMLLSDGDTIDVGMFTNWEFYHTGGFCCFDRDSYTVKKGEKISFSTNRTATGEMGSGELQPLSGLTVEIYDQNWSKVASPESETADYTYTFETPGTYYLLGLDPDAGTDSADKAPATAIVKVTDPDNPEDNNRPVRKEGVAAKENRSIREQRSMELKMTDLFTDPEDDDMTFTVSVDGKEAQTAANQYRFDAGDPGTHTLVFTASDSRGAGDTYTVNLTVSANQLPKLTDPENASSSVSVKVGETARKDLAGLFTDPDGDTITYLVSRDGGDYEELKGTKAISYTPADKTACGTHTFLVKAKDDLGSSETVYTFKVDVVSGKVDPPEPVPVTQVQLSQTSFSYNGTVQRPEILQVNGSPDLKENVDYTVSWPEGSVNAGTYTVTVTGKGDYTGSASVEYTIEPLKLRTLTLSKTAFTYNKKVQKPVVTKVTAENGKACFAEGKDYKVIWPKGCVNAGSYQVTVQGIGNYTGNVAASFVINKAANKLTVKPAKKTIKAKKKVKLKITNPTGGKLTLKITKGKKAVKLLKKGKTYYVQGLKKGKAEITVTSAATANYTKSSKVVKITVK